MQVIVPCRAVYRMASQKASCGLPTVLGTGAAEKGDEVDGGAKTVRTVSYIPNASKKPAEELQPS